MALVLTLMVVTRFATALFSGGPTAAAITWCSAHPAVVIAAGSRLGKFPPDALTVSVGGHEVPVRQFRELGDPVTGIDALIAREPPDHIVQRWKTEDSASFDVACRAAAP